MDVTIALGANLPSHVGPPVRTLIAAIGALPRHGLHPVSVSRFYRNPAFPAGSGPDFVNAAVMVRPSCTPAEALRRLHRIEAEFGRARGARWAPRRLDLDLVTWGNVITPDRDTVQEWMSLDPAAQANQSPEGLILPHPRLHQRAFVLAPMLDVAPRWRHPLTGMTVSEMWERLPEAERAAVIPL